MLKWVRNICIYFWRLLCTAMTFLLQQQKHVASLAEHECELFHNICTFVHFVLAYWVVVALSWVDWGALLSFVSYQPCLLPLPYLLLSMPCCCNTASLCLINFFAFLRVRSDSICKHSDSGSSLMPMRRQSWIISCLRFSYSQLM